MTKPEYAYGVYQLDELNWKFFGKEHEATDFKSEDGNRFGPHKFSFEEAIQQFSNDCLAMPGTLFVTEEEFKKILNGEDIELSFFQSDDAEEQAEQDGRKDPGERSFEDTADAIYWLRACCMYILEQLQEYAAERDGVMEDFDYYDGFLSRLETLVDDHLGEIEDFEKVLEGLYDGYIGSEEYD